MKLTADLFSVKGKIVVITGAAGQLGRVLAKTFNQAGARVAGVDINNKFKNDENMEYYKADIANKKDVLRTWGKIMQKYGRIDILVNNAGVSTFEKFEERPEEKIDWVMNVNLKGTFLSIQSYVNLFDKFKLKNGNIINIASVYGLVSPDFSIYKEGDRKNSEIYGATKAGIIQMTKYFAVYLAGKNIRVNAVSPGGIFNPENPQAEDFVKNYSARCPMKRMARDEEIIGAVIYLASDAASYVTGINIVVDGGMSSW